MQQGPVSRLNGIDQFFGHTFGPPGLQKPQGMELFRLKHKWLFHGRLEMPCPCLSRPQEKGVGGGLKILLNWYISNRRFQIGSCQFVTWKKWFAVVKGWLVYDLA
ncbi:hypothetical protein F7725_025304 [Dissostichus mawsoni]|uniref:Uncharacterized protein n=1 Tax=Dissostichus mawsoni TaxID=36200 RepID=A0A7J5XAS1_DISMA|nr:hypothetical protein F7725_025304 [Dissostichus mawsoni]